jgi:2-succinyl-5-enolpyruvyl-6-hydroxy-3-cyclohexene-1-carboxylate synthase
LKVINLYFCVPNLIKSNHLQQHVYTISQTCQLLGIKHAVICPGSRSAPLVFAFTQNKNITCYSIVDERSAGYIALGMAQQLQLPVALICTSGTAALNFYPAIAEAYYQKIPLLVLTADRPSELLNQQDGQMIDQKNVYGNHVRACYELPNYLHGKESFKETFTIVSEAIHISNGVVKGPVHINVPLSEPLYPDNYEIAKLQNYEITKLPNQPILQSSKHQIKKAWNESKKKLILVGQYPVDNDLFTSLYRLKNQNDVVILCDVLSNKQSVCTTPYYDFILSHLDEEKLTELEPDMIVSFGGSVLSKSLKIWLKRQKPKHHFRIQQNNEQVDTYKNVTSFIEGNPTIVLKNLTEKNPGSELSEYKNLWEKLDELTSIKVKSFLAKENNLSELHAMETVLSNLPDAINLHISNSSSVRYLSLLGNLNPSWTMDGNRGTSGIDGCTSTAVGAAIINHKPTVLITGDLGFLYDRNALWNNHIPNNLRIIVFNNFGGGIFQLIDGPSNHNEQLTYFTTPHYQSVKNTCIDNGLNYYSCVSQKDLAKTMKQFLDPMKKAALLELNFNRDENAKIFHRFKKIQLI